MNLSKLWYQNHPISYVLWPLSWLFWLVMSLRRWYLLSLKPAKAMGVPVVVVGNITVGGTGKTPVVMVLVKYCQEVGLRPGIVSRGYGSTIKDFPHLIQDNDQAVDVGDEPLLLSRQTKVPVCIAPKRREAAQYLIEHNLCDMIISDDGLQHYHLYRDLELVVVDAKRQFGNGLLLPAGPLREPRWRLKQADRVIVNGADSLPSWGNTRMQLVASDWINMLNPAQTKPLAELSGQSVCAVAGIGDPGRFFEGLEALGLKVKGHPFPDHHAYQSSDLESFKGQCLVMTAKDAIKCETMVGDDAWIAPVEAQFDPDFKPWFISTIQRIHDEYRSA